MKKLLAILVLGLLWCNVSVAGEMNVFKKNITAKKDVVGKEKDPPEEVDIQKLLLLMKENHITHCVFISSC